MTYGDFSAAGRAFTITEPLPPKPWINYLGNRRLSAFVSQNAGGLLWYLEPYTRRVTRYHYVAPPGDRPGFYVYLRDRRTGDVWNPHFAPTGAALDSFACRHEPGVTTFVASRGGLTAELALTIPPDRDVMLWQVTLTAGAAAADVQCVSYLEFGLLEFMREAIGWCYLKNHFGVSFDPELNAIRYDYHVFEAPDCPAMLFGCTVPVDGWECSREAFIGRAGSLAAPAALAPGHDLANSQLPAGGHATASLGVNVRLGPGESRTFAYVFSLAADWQSAIAQFRGTTDPAAALAASRATWDERFARLQVATGDPAVDRFVNVWNPVNALTALEHCRIISTDHMGTDGLRFRDTSQDAMAAVTLDPDFARARQDQVLAQQTQDGGGCFAFFPHTSRATTDEPHRADNPVWPIYTVHALVAETGDLAYLDRSVPWRDGGRASIHEHLRRGLDHIWARRGPHGLPKMFGADWNDGLALFQDPAAESVMLAEQFVYAARLFADLARRRGADADAAHATALADEMAAAVDTAAWDGRWYRRLLLSNGRPVGSADNAQGRIYLNAQSWAVLAGIASPERARQAMAAAAEHLDTPYGLAICDPPYVGFPEPDDPPLGNNPGIGENGAVFCHANTWAIVAEALLGNADRAWKYYRQLLPANIIARFGEDHYGREPYVYVSSVTGPRSAAPAQGGISWLSGTASWMYVAVTQYLLGLRPTLDGLLVAPCLPAAAPPVTVTRHWRGQPCRFTLTPGGTQLHGSEGPVPGNTIVAPGGTDYAWR